MLHGLYYVVNTSFCICNADSMRQRLVSSVEWCCPYSQEWIPTGY